MAEPDPIHLSRRLRMAVFLSGIAIGVVGTWAHRYAMNADGIIYLDLADAYARGDWPATVNALRSPLFPALLGLVFRLAPTTPAREFQIAHIVVFLCYVAAMAAFEWLFWEVCRARARGRSRDPRSELSPMPVSALYLLSYAGLAAALVVMIGFARVIPDHLGAAAIFCGLAVLARLAYRSARAWEFAALGAFLGLGFLARTAVIVALPICIAGGVVLTHGVRARVLGSMLCMAVFAAVISPHVWAISRQLGRFSLSEGGRLNHEWFAAHTETRPDRYGDPIPVGLVHPVRRTDAVRGFRWFAEPIKGTHPWCLDPTYWYEGTRARPDLARQLALFRSNVHLGLGLVFGCLGPLTMCLFLAAALGGLRSRRRHVLRVTLVWLAPGLVVALSHCLLVLEPRYIAAYAAAAVVFLASAVELGQQWTMGTFPKASVLAVWAMLAGGSGVPAMSAARSDLDGEGRTAAYMHRHVAVRLGEMGIGAGARVGYVGDDFLNSYWARLARVRIVADIVDGADFAALDERCRLTNDDGALRPEVVAAFRDAGACAIVAQNVTWRAARHGWEHIVTTPFYVYRIGGPKPARVDPVVP